MFLTHIITMKFLQPDESEFNIHKLHV